MTITNGNQSRARKQKGREAENLVVEYMRARGFSAERRRLTGIEDCGDIACRKLVVEVKAHKTLAFGPWLEELAIEIQNADRRFPEDLSHAGVVIARRKGRPFVGDWYAVMPAEKLLDLLLLLGFK